jgi:protein-tyrosine kinase
MGAKLGLPVLAEVPDAASAMANGKAAIRRLHLEGSRRALAGLRSAVDDLHCALVTDTRGGAAEVAIGIATAAALEGRRTLLMECNLVRPVLAARLGLRRTPGLHEYLAWQATAPELLQPLELAGAAVGPGGSAGQLVCVVGGEPTHEAPGLIASYSFAGAMRKVRKAYDLVVLAAGPLETEELSLIAPFADAVALCAGEHQVAVGSRGVARALSRIPERPIGVVLVSD